MGTKGGLAKFENEKAVFVFLLVSKGRGRSSKPKDTRPNPTRRGSAMVNAGFGEGLAAAQTRASGLLERGSSARNCIIFQELHQIPVQGLSFNTIWSSLNKQPLH